MSPYDLFLLLPSSGSTGPPGEDELNQPGLAFDARRALVFSKGILLSSFDRFVSSKALNVLLAQITSGL